jgi:PadR family transcriptional regulator AphA
MALRQVILTVLSRRPMTGYEITRQFDTVLQYFWKASHQQVYRELAALSADARVSVREVAQRGKPDKKVYRLTRRGRDELRAWLLAPSDYVPARVDLLVKLLATPVIGAAAMQRIFDDHESQIDEIIGGFRQMEMACRDLPDDRKGDLDPLLMLVLRRGILLAEAQRRWLGEVDAHLRSRTKS